MCVCLYECMPHMLGGQRQTSDLELELQMVVTHSMWVLGTDLEALEEQQLFSTSKLSVRHLLPKFEHLWFLSPFVIHDLVVGALT